MKKFLRRTTENADLLKRIPGNLNDIPRVCTHCVGPNKTYKCLNGQQTRSLFLPDRSYSTVFVESMRKYAAFHYEKSHIMGSVNIAADFLSWLECKLIKKIRLKI